MQNLHMDAGCVFDTLAFLSAYLGQTAGTRKKSRVQYENEIIQKIQNSLRNKETIIPHYLYPFFARVNGHLSFMDLLLLDGVPYSHCKKDDVFRTLKNTSLVLKKYVEHYFHGISARTVQHRITEHPGGIDMIKELSLDPTLEMYVYYSIIRNNEIMEALYSVFECVYNEIENEHNAFISSCPGMAQFFDDSTDSKLRMLSGAGDNERLKYTFTLAEPRKISFQSAEPAFLLLGSDFHTVLETEYKYICATPYNFALAIGNPTKYAIYQALQKKSSMTRAEMEITLHLSRAALDHNLKDMRQSGLVVMSKRRGENYYYELDPEVIRTAAEQMLAETYVNRK